MYISEQASKFSPLSPQEEYELCTRYIKTKDPNIKREIVYKNIRLVIKIVNEFPRIHQQDLIGEGLIGLIEGIEKYDPEKGKLSTYVAFWIRAYIFKYILYNSKIIKFGTNWPQRKALFNVHKVKAKLEAEGKDATAEIIANELNIDEKIVQDLKGFEQVNISSPEEIKTINDIASDCLPADETLSILEENTIIKKKFDLFKQLLNDNERKVLDERLLFVGDKKKTLNMVGSELRLSRQRMCQVENKVVAKLKEFWQSNKE